VFNVPVVIQLTDDEAVLWKDLKVENVNKLVKETTKEIISIGFDVSKTFIFSSFTYMGQTPEYYRNIIRVRKSVTYGKIKETFGFNDSDSIGKIVFPSIQLIPTLSNTFPDIFGDQKVQALCVCGIDQEPYFQLMKDISPALGFPEPAILHCKFIPALSGVTTKMSSSDANTAIFLTDTAKQIKTKVNKHAFSGGKVTVEEHRELGGDTTVDVAYHILKYFLPDDDELEKIRLAYSSGEMLTGEIKKLAIECIQEIVTSHQDKKKAVTDPIIEQFMKPRK
jgi:tryptophanyl-tRNA synthetase